MFSTKTLNLPRSLGNVETQWKLDVPEPETGGSPEKNETALDTPPVFCELQTLESPEHIETALTTPPLCQNVTSRSMKHMERTEVQNSHDFGASCPQQSKEREQLLERNDIPMEEVMESYIIKFLLMLLMF